MSKIEDFSPFTFNEDQSIAAGLIEQFLDNPVDRVFVLSGHAGTGKTSMITAIIRYLTHKEQTPVLLASTGRAAKVVSEKSGFKAETIHKHIYKMDVDEADDEKKIKKLTFKLRHNIMSENAIYIVDESSMISNHRTSSVFINFGSGKLLSDLFYYTGSRKIIFIGDPAQLPPVNTLFSPCLNGNYLKNELNKTVVFARLNEIMRQKGHSGISYNSNALRMSITKNNLGFMKIKCSGFDDITIHQSNENMSLEYYKAIKSCGIDSTIFLTLSNGLASEINKNVRSYLFPISSSMMKNELLMVVQNNYKFDLTNGEHIHIVEVGETRENRAGLTFREITAQIKDTEGFRIFNAKIIEDLLYTKKPSLNQEQEYHLYKDFMIRTSKKGIRPKDREFLNELITDPYLNAIKARFGYAVNCHKAQGGEWDHVFIALEKSLFMRQREYQYRWAYTAISRAVKRLDFLDNICIF